MKGTAGWLSGVFTSQGSWSVWHSLLLWLALVLLIAAPILRIVARRWIPPKRLLALRAAKFGAGLAGLGLLILFFDYQRALYLSSPLILIGWVVLLGVWIGLWLVPELRGYPAARRAYEDESRRSKWLPGQKKRRRRG